MSFEIVNMRRRRLVALVEKYGFLPTKELSSRLKISEAIVRRDLSALKGLKKIKHTYDKALFEYDRRFPSFTERLNHSPLAKARIATAALPFVNPGNTCFFDAGSTVFSIAEAFCERPVTPLKVVTWSIPVAELLAGIDGVEVFLVAGQFLKHQSILLGESARNSLAFWHFDLAFLSAEIMDPHGIWNSQIEIVEQQQVVLRQTVKSIFCMDRSKLKWQRAHYFLIQWCHLDTLVTDVPLSHLQHTGIEITETQHRLAE